MKRRLSLLLAVVMILGSFSMAFAAEKTAEEEAGAFLMEVGVLEGINGELKLEDNLRRQDAVVLIARLHGAEEEAEKFPTDDLTFTDFKDPYYRPIIAWAVANNLVEGHTPERFGFNEDVTAQQYATILLRALGYNEEVAEKEGYDKALELAKELGILENVEVENDTAITRGQMAVLTFNALGTNMKDSDKTLADKLGIEMPEPEVLKVEEVKADNLKEIKVVFNKDIDMSVFDSDNYETNAGEIEDAFVENGNVLVIRLEDPMTNKRGYKLTISRMEEINGEYKFTAYDNIVPEVVEVVALGTKAVKVVMSEPVKDAKIGDFKLDGKTLYGTTELLGREIVVKPYKAMEVGEHELTIGRLEDFAGFKSVERNLPFEVVEDKEKPTVVEVQATLESAVIIFSEDIDKDSVSKYNVYHGNKVYPENAVKIAGNKIYVDFTAEKALPVYETTLYVSNFTDYSGNKMDPAEIKVKPSIDETRPEVIKVELQNDLKTIAVKFSKSVNKKDAEDLSNYTILDPRDNKVTISEVKVDGRVVEIVLGKELAENKEYTLKISNIRDNNKYPNTMYPYEGKISVGDVSAPEVKYVSGSYDSEKKVSSIHIFFNKDMDLGTLADPNNYLVEINGVNKLLSDVDGDVDIVKSDGTVVLLTVNKKVDKVGVLGVKDTTGKKLSNYGEMFKVERKEFKFEGAVAKAKDTVELKFSLPVDKAPRSAFSFDGSATVKDVDISGEYVILTLGTRLPADASEKLTIADEEVVAFNGAKLEKKEDIELTDRIAPSIVKVDAEYEAGDENVVLKVTFDENIEVNEAAKTDLVVKKINGDAVVDFEIVDVEDKVMTINVPVKENILPGDANEDTKFETAFEVKVVEGARFIFDGSNNVAVASSARSARVKGIVLPVVEEPEEPEDPEDPGDEDKPELVEARFYPLVPFDPDTGEPITTGSGQLRIKLANAEDAYEYTVTYYTTGKTEVTSPVVGINAPVLVVWNGEDPMTITIYNEAGDVVATFTGVIPIV